MFLLKTGKRLPQDDVQEPSLLASALELRPSMRCVQRRVVVVRATAGARTPLPRTQQKLHWLAERLCESWSSEFRE